MSLDTFQGLSTDALQFLAELRDNNHREWFLPRKSHYETVIKIPMESLAVDVAAICQKSGFAVFPKQPSPVSRIYRDTRFSPDKRPYHHHAAITLERRAASMQSGGIYLHIQPAASFIAAGLYMPESGLLRAIRLSIAEQPAKFEQVIEQLRKKKLVLSTEGKLKLKRMPRGFDNYAESSVADYLKLNGFVTSRMLSDAEVTSPKLVKLASDFVLNVRPLLEFGWSIPFKPAVLRERDLG